MDLLFIFLTGLAIGSFLNVCITRLPQEKSIVFPPSRCPNCRHKLSAVDLIPIMGYLFLRGRCRYCKSHISIRYPFVEILTAASFVFVYLKNGLSINLFFGLLFISLLIVIFFSDLETQIIPDPLNIIGVIGGLIFYFLRKDFYWPIFGLMLGIIIMSAIYFIGLFLYKREALGIGDIKLGAMLGAFLGAEKVIYSIFLSYILGAIIALALIIFRIRKKEDLIPFGPFMALAAVILYFY